LTMKKHWWDRHNPFPGPTWPAGGDEVPRDGGTPAAEGGKRDTFGVRMREKTKRFGPQVDFSPKPTGLGAEGGDQLGRGFFPTRVWGQVGNGSGAISPVLGAVTPGQFDGCGPRIAIDLDDLIGLAEGREAENKGGVRPPCSLGPWKKKSEVKTPKGGVTVSKNTCKTKQPVGNFVFREGPGNQKKNERNCPPQLRGWGAGFFRQRGRQEVRDESDPRWGFWPGGGWGRVSVGGR